MKEISGYVRMFIDKLQGIRGDLIRTDDNWREWYFPKFVEALRKWTERNPVELELNEKPPDRKKPPFLQDRSFQALQKDKRARGCVYCEKPDHRSVDCKTAASVHERKRVERQPSSPSQQRSWKSSTIGEPCEEVANSRNYCIVERVSGPVTGRREFYIPHKPVLQEPQKQPSFVLFMMHLLVQILEHLP